MGILTNLDAYPTKPAMIIYGPPKSGKTTALAKVPKGAKMYLIDVDKQAKNFLNAWKDIHGDFKGLEIYQIETGRGPKHAFEDLKKAYQIPSGFNFYAADSYSTTSNLISMNFAGTKGRNYNMQSNTSISSWIQDMFWDFVHDVEAENGWAILVCWERWETIDIGLTDPKDWKDKKEQVAPEMASSTARRVIPGNVPFVLHIEKGMTRSKVDGRLRIKSASEFRTQGTKFIMASCTGFEDKVDDLMPADIGLFLGKCGLSWQDSSSMKEQKKKVKKNPRPLRTRKRGIL